MCTGQLLDIGFSVDHRVPQYNSINILALCSRHHRQRPTQTESYQTELRYIAPFLDFSHSRPDVFQPSADMSMAGIASGITASVKIKTQNMKSGLGETRSELAIRAVRGNILVAHWIAKDYSATSPSSSGWSMITSEKARSRRAKIKRLDIHLCLAGAKPSSSVAYWRTYLRAAFLNILVFVRAGAMKVFPMGQDFPDGHEPVHAVEKIVFGGFRLHVRHLPLKVADMNDIPRKGCLRAENVPERSNEIVPHADDVSVRSYVQDAEMAEPIVFGPKTRIRVHVHSVDQVNLIICLRHGVLPPRLPGREFGEQVIGGFPLFVAHMVGNATERVEDDVFDVDYFLAQPGQRRVASSPSGTERNQRIGRRMTSAFGDEGSAPGYTTRKIVQHDGRTNQPPTLDACLMRNLIRLDHEFSLAVRFKRALGDKPV